jgi:TPR repeat protein
MRNSKRSAAVLLVISAAVALAWMPTSDNTLVRALLPKPTDSRTQAQGQSAPAVSTVPSAVLDKVSQTDYKKEFASSNNYWEFAHAILPAAKAGNAAAQFYLYRVLERCDEYNRMYFQHRGQHLALDQGLQFAVQRHLSIDVAQSVFDRCHLFQENDLTELGSATDWLEKATDAGHPLAEATTAGKILEQDMRRRLAQAGGVPNPSNSVEVGNGADPRELLKSAVRSKDPEVIFSIGEAQSLLNPSNSDTNATRFAWWLVACQRGFDCSGDAEWVKSGCAEASPCSSASGPSELIRILSRDEWPEVQQRAQEISSKLDAGKWDDLGLGLTASQPRN